MIFSDRLLFLHVPKAGGTSIVHCLMDVLPKPVYYSLPADHPAVIPDGVHRFPGVAHETLEEARVVLARHDVKLEELPVVVACIRNPYELEVSRYSFLRGDLESYNHGAQQALALAGDFELFARYSRPHGTRPIETYFLLDGAVPANLRIVRLENIDAELAECLEAAGVDAGPTAVHHHNRSEHDSFTRYYTPAAEQAVYEKYKWVFSSGLYERLESADDQPATVDDGDVVDRLLAEVLPSLETEQDHFGLANAWLAAAEIHRQSFGNGAQHEALGRALSHARHVGSDRLTDRISIQLAQCFSLAGSHPVDDGIEGCRALIGSGRKSPAVTQVVLAELLAATGRFEEARGICERAVAAPPTRHLADVELLAQTAAGSVELLAGDAEAAVARFQHGCPWRPISFVGDFAEALYRVGRYAEAERLARLSQAISPAGDVKAQVGWRRIRAKLMARNGASEQACYLARAAVSMIERCDAPNVHADALVDLAEVLRIAGRTEDATAALEDAMRLYDRKGNTVSAAGTLLRDPRDSSAAQAACPAGSSAVSGSSG
ncbi:MAG: sulfotransferase family protein [Actinomycetota bacterium]|jgi:tetratricopeptide (TPR) repeat protein|nr:sulfotransferase family protein [Actinomycetota bacterium]